MYAGNADGAIEATATIRIPRSNVTGHTAIDYVVSMDLTGVQCAFMSCSGTDDAGHAFTKELRGSTISESGVTSIDVTLSVNNCYAGGTAFLVLS